MKTVQKIKSESYNRTRKAANIARFILAATGSSAGPTVVRALTEADWDEIGDHHGYKGVSPETRDAVIALVDIQGEADSNVAVVK